MPLLAGGRLIDASANSVQDASSNYIGEDSIQVVIGSDGILYAGNQGADLSIGEDIDDIFDTVSGLFDLITGIVNGTILLTQVSHIDTQLGNVEQDVDWLVNETEAITSNGTNTLQTILDAIAALAAGGLTVEEHDQLMGIVVPSTEQIAGDVWGYTLSLTDMKGVDSGPMAQTVLCNAGLALQFILGYEGLKVPDREHFRFIASDSWYTSLWLGDWTATGETGTVPELDLSLVQSGDTVWNYLQREYPGYTWLHTGPGSRPIGDRIYVEQSPGSAYYVCTLTDADIRNWWPPTSDPPPTVNVELDVPPVWPGAGSVTLGAPVALTSQLVLDGPMDGVLVTITTPPSGVGRRQIGGALFDYQSGEMTFRNDSGYMEPWQYLGFRSAIYTPRTMKQADAALFRVLAGAEGTVRTFVRS